MVANNQYQKIVPFIIFVLVLLLLFKLIQPMIVILMGSILLAYIAWPIFKRIKKIIPNKTISIILSLIIIVVIILIPFSFLAVGITQQGYYFYNSLSHSIEKGALLGFSCTSADSDLCLILNTAEKFSVDQLSAFGLDRKLQELLPTLENIITDFILNIPLLIAQIFIALIISYFILANLENITKKISDIIPVRTTTKKRLIKEFGNITHTVIYAQLLVAFVQGVVGMIGFYILGVPFPIILGLLMAFCALIPAIGTAFVWAPISLAMIIIGFLSPNYWIMGKGLILFFYGLLVISIVDNILLAKIVSAKAKVNPITVIIGVIGGAAMFGIIGIFIGPILLPLILTYFETFKERFA